MLECTSIYTYELDDAEAARKELLAQLNRQISLQDNTVGILMCHPEFVVSGVAQQIGAAMPFPVVGCTTASQAVNAECGEMILTLFIMTSDDVIFRAGCTGDLDDDIGALTGAAFEQAAGDMREQAKLVLIFPPYFFGISGDEYVRIWEKTLPGTPVFGTMAVDDTPTFTETENLYDDKTSKKFMPFVICYGNINPRFSVNCISITNKIAQQKGVVTRSEGTHVYSIDGISAYRYLQNHEYTKNLPSIDNLYLTPFMIDLYREKNDDGVPVVRGLARFDGDGAAVFHGDVDIGDVITPLGYKYNDIISSAVESAKAVNRMQEVHGVLAFPCIVRRMIMLGMNPLAEFEAFVGALNPDIPFMMGYAGGEFCPTSVKGAVPCNRYHNYTLVMLIL